MILFDANVLIHAHAMRSPLHETAKRLRDQAVSGDLAACISPQVLCEFFSVSTNSRLFQPAMTPQQAAHEVALYWKSGFHRILPTETTMIRLADLLSRHRIKGRDVFDVFLVATMLENGVNTIYTENVKDFEVYPELRVVNPLGSPAPST